MSTNFYSDREQTRHVAKRVSLGGGSSRLYWAIDALSFLGVAQARDGRPLDPQIIVTVYDEYGNTWGWRAFIEMVAAQCSQWDFSLVGEEFS